MTNEQAMQLIDPEHQDFVMHAPLRLKETSARVEPQARCIVSIMGNDGDRDTEVMLYVEEARALHEWLGKVLP